MENLKTSLKLLIVTSLSLSILGTTGCSRKKSTPNNPAAPVTEPAPGGDAPLPVEPTPGDNNNDGQTDLPQEPTDLPEPIPAPTNPVAPGQPIGVKAISKTTSFILPLGGIKGNYINVELTWQPVHGAKEYWVYKNVLPPKEQANKGTAYKILKSEGLISTLFIDGAIPPSFQGGNIWDKIKKGFSAVNLKPGVEYKYKVFAADADGNVIGESDAAVTVPLPPIAPPVNIQVSDTQSVKPVFKWDTAQGAEPDGYYVSVYPPINFGRDQLQQGTSFGLSYWSTYRSKDVKEARYGSQSDNSVSYPGTLPFDINFPLKNGARYSVSVTGVKTDSNDMRTAKAISKSWSESKIFNIGTPANTQPATVAPQTQQSSGGFMDKIKGILGL